MTSIDTKGISGGLPTRMMTREEFFAGEAETDKKYDEYLAFTKTYQIMSKIELKTSRDPWSVMGRMKISDHEREILAEVAKLNGWSRQATEATYQMFFAGPTDSNSIGDFLKDLATREPGQFHDGGVILGLHEADRRRLMGLPPIDETSAQQEIPQDEASDAKTPKKSAANDRMKWVATSLSKKLTADETTALSKAAKLNGWGDESAAAAYKMYLAENSNGSLQSFLQLLAQLEPDAYDKNGSVEVRKNGNDKDRLLHVEV